MYYFIRKGLKKKFWQTEIRKNLGTDASGSGMVLILAGIGEFENLVGKKCNYVITAAKKFAVMQYNICKIVANN